MRKLFLFIALVLMAACEKEQDLAQNLDDYGSLKAAGEFTAGSIDYFDGSIGSYVTGGEDVTTQSYLEGVISYTTDEKYLGSGSILLEPESVQYIGLCFFDIDEDDELINFYVLPTDDEQIIWVGIWNLTLGENYLSGYVDDDVTAGEVGVWQKFEFDWYDDLQTKLAYEEGPMSDWEAGHDYGFYIGTNYHDLYIDFLYK